MSNHPRCSCGRLTTVWYWRTYGQCSVCQAPPVVPAGRGLTRRELYAQRIAAECPKCRGKSTRQYVAKHGRCYECESARRRRLGLNAEGQPTRCPACGGGSTAATIAAHGLCSHCRLTTPQEEQDRYLCRREHQHTDCEAAQVIDKFIAELRRHGSLRAMHEHYERRPRPELLIEQRYGAGIGLASGRKKVR